MKLHDVQNYSSSSTMNVMRHFRGSPCQKSVASSAVFGWDTACVLYANGTVMCLGDNSSGQCGRSKGNLAYTDLQPALTAAGKSVTSLFDGDEVQCVLHNDSSVSCWGWNGYGQLGHSSSAPCDKASLGNLSLPGPSCRSPWAGTTPARCSTRVRLLLGDACFGQLGAKCWKTQREILLLSFPQRRQAPSCPLTRGSRTHHPTRSAPSVR
jgi:hypothetical protein